MDVKGAKALSERLAEAARNVDPPPAKAVGPLAAPESVDVADDRLGSSSSSRRVATNRPKGVRSDEARTGHAF